MTVADKQNPVTSNLRGETRALLALTLPLLIAQMAQMGTGIVDTIMAGRYGTEDLAAIGIGYNIWLPVFLIAMGVMQAVAVIAAQHYGAGRVREIRELLPQATWLALAVGILSVPLCLFPGPVLGLLSLEATTYAKAEGYLQATAWGLPGAALFQALRSHVQGIGIVRPFAIASVIGFLANIPLNYAFIYGAWGIPAMGAIGCGWATAISMWLSPILIGFYMLRSPSLREFLPRGLWHRPQRAALAEIFHLGLPIGLAFFLEMAVFSVIALMVATHGTREMASYQIAFNVYDVVYMPLISIGAAMATRMGHAIGRHSMREVRLALISTTLVATGFCILMSILLMFLPDSVVTLYTEDTGIRLLASSLLKMVALFVMLDMIAILSSFALRAFKDTRYPFLVMAIAYWLIALPLGYYLAMTDPNSELYGARGFWWAMITGIAVAGGLTVVRLRLFLRGPLPAQLPDNGDNQDSLSA